MKNKDIAIDKETLTNVVIEFFKEYHVEALEPKLWDLLFAAVSNPMVDSDANNNGDRMFFYRNLVELFADLWALAKGEPLPERDR